MFQWLRKLTKKSVQYHTRQKWLHKKLRGYPHIRELYWLNVTEVKSYSEHYLKRLVHEQMFYMWFFNSFSWGKTTEGGVFWGYTMLAVQDRDFKTLRIYEKKAKEILKEIKVNDKKEKV